MARTAIIYSERYLEHETGKNHPERPQRLKAIINGIKKSGLLESGRCILIEPEYISLENLQLVHTLEYINHVRHICNSGGGLLSEETVVSKESFDVARLAAGGAINSVHRIMLKDFDNAFALIRPPGHHAGPNYSLGFCIFNNIALAASYLTKEFGLKRILVLDVDAHHGNGTQEIFYNTNNVLFISIHEDPTDFPGTGFIKELGLDDGLGYTVNIPLPYGAGDPSYWKTIKTIVIPIAYQYKPQFVLVSAGFDGYYRDGVSELTLSAYIYPKVFQMILDLAHDLCDGKLAAFLEGGYNLRFLKKVVPACIAKMAGITLKIRDRRPPINLKAQREADKIIERVKKIHSRFWSL